MSGTGFVIPDVRAIAETAAYFVVDAFETVELAVGSAEGGGGAESGEIGHGGFEDDGRQRGAANGLDELFGALFECWEVLGGVFGGAPGIVEFGGVPVTNDGAFFALGCVPAAASGRAIGKMPGEEEFVVSGLVGSDGAFKTKSTDRIRMFGFRA